MASKFHFPCLLCGKLYMHMNGTDLFGGCPAKIHHPIPDQPSHSVVEQPQSLHPTLTTAPQDKHEPPPTSEPINATTTYRPQDPPSGHTAQHTDEPTVHFPIQHWHLTFTADQFDPTKVYEKHSSKKDYVELPPADKLPDSLAFRADPKLLANGNLLRLAQNNSNSQIMQKANKDRRMRVFKSTQAVARRLQGAYKWSAKQNGVHPDVVKQWLKKTRAENGVGVRETRQKEIDETLGQLDSRVQGWVEVSSSGAPGSAATLGELDSQRLQGWRDASGSGEEPAAKRMKANGNEMAVRSD
ncbi:hypothetical protein LTR17_017010 [Elasticomyces elasticus]|nr:hypothetical protein LTR17_017010 [Elasticomyces elasticus]